MSWVSDTSRAPIKKETIIKCRISKIDDLGNKMVSSDSSYHEQSVIAYIDDESLGPELCVC